MPRGIIGLIVIVIISSILHYFRKQEQFGEYLDVPTILKALNYPVEEHDFYTKEGYLIKIFRIQKKNQTTFQSNKKPILLLHGLNCDSSIWIGNYENKSLAFMLANQDLDVWMTNDRGTQYSRKHKTLDPDLNKTLFWNYTWDQTALIDLPQVIEYIGNIVKQKISVLAFSQGLSQIMAVLSEQNKVVDKWIDHKVFSFGGTTFLYNNRAIAIYLAQKLYVFEIMEYLGFYEYNDSLQIVYWSSKYLHFIFRYMLMTFTDGDGSPIDISRFVYFVYNFPSGTSVRNYIQCMQLSRDNYFRKFNYGSKELNQLHYGQDEPPSYDLSKITRELYLFHGEYDLFSSIKDAKQLMGQLENAKIHYYEKKLGHLAFILSNVTDHIQEVIDVIKKDNSSRLIV